MIKIGVFQMTSVQSLEANKAWILDQLHSHDLNSLKYIFFPENSLSLKINSTDTLDLLDLKDPFINELTELAKINDLEIQMATAIKNSEGQVYNSSFWITDQGIKSVYNKIHLFKVILPTKRIDENESFKTGSEPVVHTSKNGLKFGSSICFDLRFPKLYQYYAEQKVDVITVPSAFIERTGKDHWHVLLRARAIETQAYVVASAQAGSHVCERTHQVRKTWGHSLVVDPWGNVILDAGQEAGFFTCYIDPNFLQKTRAILPLERTFKG
jgi:predicted amidohydrolase